jgi:hypothetical protein
VGFEMSNLNNNTLWLEEACTETMGRIDRILEESAREQSIFPPKKKDRRTAEDRELDRLENSDYSLNTL